MVLRGESSPFRSAVGAAHDCFQWGPLESDDAQVTRRHRSRKVSELSARSDRVAKTTILPGACSCLHARVERVWKLRRKPAAQLRKKISAVIALTLPILSINPDGVSAATVAVKDNKFTYPGILSFELESLYEGERACASIWARRNCGDYA